MTAMNSRQTNRSTAPNGSTSGESDVDSSIPTLISHTQVKSGMLLFDPLLATLAAGLEDIEKVRIAQSHRLRILTRTEADADGEFRGFGLDESHPMVAALSAQLDGLIELNKAAGKTLDKQMKTSRLHPWISGQFGLGDRQMARLLGTIRDPYWNDLHDRPRTVSELWAYCGLHVLPASHYAGKTHSSDADRTAVLVAHYVGEPHLSSGGESSGGDTGHSGSEAHSNFVGVAAKRRRGVKANWSTEAKTRCYLIAESCVKARRKPCVADDETGLTAHVTGCVCSPYRIVYDDGRAKYAESVHAVACPPCSALPGAPLKDGHKHARAMRLVMKAVLKDLWIESKRIYEGAS